MRYLLLVLIAGCSEGSTSTPPPPPPEPFSVGGGIPAYASKFDQSGLYLGCEITWHAVERGLPVKAVGYDVGGDIHRTGTFTDSAQEQFIPHPGPVFTDPMNVVWTFTVDGVAGAQVVMTFHQNVQSGCSPGPER